MRTRLMPDVDCNWKGCRVRLAVTTGSPSYFSEPPYLWSQPRGLSRTGQLLDDQEIHSVGGVQVEVAERVSWRILGPSRLCAPGNRRQGQAAPARAAPPDG